MNPLRKVVQVAAPIVTAKVIKEGRRYVKLFKARYEEVKRERANG